MRILCVLFALTGTVRAAQLPAAPGSADGAAFPAALAPEVAAPHASADALLVRLRDGRPLWGWIEAHDANEVAVRRLDNGGLARLSWGLLDAAQERALRLEFGYLALEEEELLIQADAIPLITGKQVVGRIVHRSEDALHLKTAQSLLVIPKTQIGGAASSVQVPALEIYTRAELYEQRLAEKRSDLEAQGARAISAHEELARFSERILDFAHAVEHWSALRELAPEHEPEVCAAALARAELKLAAQAEVDYLERVETEKKRGRFDASLELAAAFPKLFPKSPLQEEWLKLQGRVQKAQEAELAARVAPSWHAQAARLTREAARKYSFAQALEYLEDKFATDLREAVTKDLQPIASRVGPEEVRALWSARSGGRWQRASYGLGTWLLGEDKARAGLEDEAAEAEGEKDSARAELEEKIKRYLENQELARRSAEGPADGEDPEAFWKSFPLNSRAQWLLAHYAEFGGDMQLREVRFENCSECGGRGVRSVLFTGNAMSASSRGEESRGSSGESLVPCPTCHNVGVVRRIVYR